MQVTPKEHPIALQLFGSDPEVMGEIAKRVEERPFDIIDVNMGCPVPKVVNNGEGSALMKNPVLVGKIVEAMAKAVEKPVTVKIRAGFNDDSINAPEIAHVIEESGGQQLPCMDGQESSIIRERQTGMLSAGSKKRLKFRSSETVIF